MTGPRPPALVRAEVALAVLALPAGERRERYRAEFLAELHELPARRRFPYVAGLLSQAFALRAALGAAPSSRVEDAMNRATAATVPWQCRVLRRHTWVRRTTEDGERYQACARCGVDRGPTSPGMTSTPPWPGDI